MSFVEKGFRRTRREHSTSCGAAVRVPAQGEALWALGQRDPKRSNPGGGDSIPWRPSLRTLCRRSAAPKSS